LLSGVAAELVRENLPPKTTLADLGEHELKDLEGHERVYQIVAPDLRRDFPALRAHKARQLWLVPEAMRTPYFTGRDDLLDRLRQQLVERHRAALSGLGGVGKTQTAIEYAVRHRIEYPGGVFWVNAETISGLTSGFVDIATALRLTAAGSNNQELVLRAMLTWFERTGQWLLILDNVDGRDDLRRFVPEHAVGDVQITSRESVFSELGIPRALEVRDLDDAEALRFLLARTGRDDADAVDRAAAAELGTELGNLPLALEQAAAYIAETNATFSSYLSAFRKRRVTLLEKAVGLVSRDTVAVTWATNFEAVQRASPAAADVLRVSAFLGPDAIPFELLLEGAQALGGPIAETLCDPDDLEIAELLRPLARYSLIRSNGSARAYGVHRLVQEVVRAALDEPARRSYVERAVAALDAALPEMGFANWNQHDRLVAHIVSIAGWLDSYDMHSDAGYRLLKETGRHLLQRGQYAEAEPLLQHSLAIAERASGLDGPDVASSLHYMALLRFFQGRYADAQTLHERALAIRERALAPDHELVSVSLNNLANVFFTLGRYTEAEQLYQRSLAIGERARGPDDPLVATTINNLAETYVKRDLYIDAKPLFERSLAAREGALGADHPHVALSLYNLANLARLSGRYPEARPLYERALAIRERAYGPGHEDIAETLAGLAWLDTNEGRYDEARQLYERALAIQERAIGPDHVEVAGTLDGLARLEGRQGRHTEAETLYKHALAIRECAVGSWHPDSARSLHGLARVALEQGRYAEAESLYERALMIVEPALGSDHPSVAEGLLGLGLLRKNEGPRAEALALYERALAIKEQTFGPEHPELTDIRTEIDALRA
jgi:tetratricopeptide (TPR) repeat protein